MVLSVNPYSPKAFTKPKIYGILTRTIIYCMEPKGGHSMFVNFYCPTQNRPVTGAKATMLTEPNRASVENCAWCKEVHTLAEGSFKAYSTAVEAAEHALVNA